jgi:rhamnopyranosyl-N-acetylglucosaminyl-diphospho-decaprenol beta-1,3/1,4-galactofuranosyltransferase
MHISAIIVTRNRLQLLKRCLEKVKNQSRKPDSILVVNNASDDGTTEWLDLQKDLLVFHNPNTGGAGGFHRGIQEAIQLKADWLWLMDDDGFPDEFALEKLLAKAQDYPASAWNSLVLSESRPQTHLAFGMARLAQDDVPLLSASIKTRQEIESLSTEGLYAWGCFFNGSLVSRRVLEEVGNVQSEYFVWGDEVDLHMRLRAVLPIYSVLDAYHFHPEPSQIHLPDWKIFYALRNGIRNARLYYSYSWIRIFRLILVYGGSLVKRFRFRLLFKALLEGMGWKAFRAYGLDP